MVPDLAAGIADMHAGVGGKQVKAAGTTPLLPRRLLLPLAKPACMSESRQLDQTVQCTIAGAPVRSTRKHQH